MFTRVAQQQAKVIERFGKFRRILEPGLNVYFPLIDQVSYTHNLKEQVYPIEEQTAITNDNVKITISGILYYKINDPYKASYAIKDPVKALSLLAQTSMRSEIGKILLDRTFEERDTLNVNIRKALNKSSEKWGIDCLRYEIKDIQPPTLIKKSMELQATNERQKRQSILESEGDKQRIINIAEGIKEQHILEGESEAAVINQEALSMVASLNQLSATVRASQDSSSMRLKLSELQIDAMSEILDKSNVLMTPHGGSSSNGNSAITPENVAQLLAVYKSIMGNPQQSATTTQAVASNDNEFINKQLQEKLDELNNQRNTQSEDSGRFLYLDNKILYNTEDEIRNNRR